MGPGVGSVASGMLAWPTTGGWRRRDRRADGAGGGRVNPASPAPSIHGTIGGMSQGFGNESPRAHAHTAHRPPARFLVLIDAGGSTVARLFLDTRELVAEFDAGTEEVAQMTARLTPVSGALGPEWDQALGGHSTAERQAAVVYLLDI